MAAFRRTVAALLPLLVFAYPLTSATQPRLRPAQIVESIDRAQEQRELRLAGYTVIEHYTIRNSRFDTAAEMVVEATYLKGIGKSFRIISRSGPSFLQTRVMDRVIKEEEEISRGDLRRNVLLISENYEIKPIGRESIQGKECDTVELTPRKKSTHLLKGKAWVDAENHLAIRVEGKPTASISFLAGRPEVVRDYEEIDGFSLARKSSALSESFILGKTELTVEYTGYHVTSSVKDKLPDSPKP